MNEFLKNFIEKTPSKNHWEKIKVKDHHGICIPLFSIYSENSAGIGEYLDLIKLVDFCKKINFNIIQLLPLNETAINDNSPYNALSSCALDPIYISLSSLKYYLQDIKLIKILKKLKRYNFSKRVKYKKVRKLKYKWLYRYYNLYFKKYFQSDSSYINFISKHISWLFPYGVYRFLKNKYKGKEFIRWKEIHKNPNEKFIKDFIEKTPEIKFYFFLQYLCFSQMSNMKNYANENKVFLKGDMPIFVNSDSSDVWYNDKIFDKRYVAGAPPDDFNFNGHKWGFYLFNWEEIKIEKNLFWKNRLLAQKDIYDLYRIDHAVGFYRIWAIPPKEKAIEGAFIPKDSTKWEQNGIEHFTMLLENSINMPIAEDLGFIPKIVYSSLKSLGLCGTKVLRWQRNIPLKAYERLSLTTLSTHDVDTMGVWWKKNKKEAKELAKINNWQYKKKLDFKLRKKILLDSHKSNSIFHISLLQEYLALFKELSYKNEKKDRINISGEINRKNWTYKYKTSLETLTSHTKLINLLNSFTEK